MANFPQTYTTGSLCVTGRATPCWPLINYFFLFYFFFYFKNAGLPHLGVHFSKLEAASILYIQSVD